MCNATTKTLLLAVFTLVLAACGRSEADRAAAMLARAQAAYDAHDYSAAVALTDSLPKAFPSAATERRAALHLHSQALEGLCTVQLAETDSLILALQARGDELQKGLKYVPQEFEGYYVMADGSGAAGREGGAPLQARLTPDRQIYLISTATGSPRHTAIRVTAPDGSNSCTAPVPYDGEANSRAAAAETVYFTGANADTIARFIFDHRSEPLTITFEGGTPQTVTLPDATVANIAQMYDFVDTSRRLKLALLRKERLEQQLTVARNQTARTSPD